MITSLNVKIFVLLFSITVSAQSKKLVESFKFDKVGYKLYSLENEPNLGLQDTSFYLLYRDGNSKVLGKELKEIKLKSNNEVLLSTTYEIYSEAIIFSQQSNAKQDINRRYKQNSKGFLVFDKYYSPKKLEIIKQTTFVPEVENTGCPEKVDVLPEFPENIGANMFIVRNVIYPEIALENNIQGKMEVSFVIEKDGSVSNIKILKGLGYGCDEEVIRVVKRMPKWKPAILNGNFVRSQMILPVTFKLEE